MTTGRINQVASPSLRAGTTLRWNSGRATGHRQAPWGHVGLGGDGPRRSTHSTPRCAHTAVPSPAGPRGDPPAAAWPSPGGAWTRGPGPRPPGHTTRGVLGAGPGTFPSRQRGSTRRRALRRSVPTFLRGGLPPVTVGAFRYTRASSSLLVESVR